MPIDPCDRSQAYAITERALFGVLFENVELNGAGKPISHHSTSQYTIPSVLCQGKYTRRSVVACWHTACYRYSFILRHGKIPGNDDIVSRVQGGPSAAADRGFLLIQTWVAHGLGCVDKGHHTCSVGSCDRFNGRVTRLTPYFMPTSARAGHTPTRPARTRLFQQAPCGRPPVLFSDGPPVLLLCRHGTFQRI